MLFVADSLGFVFVAVDDGHLPVCFGEQVELEVINRAQNEFIVLAELDILEECDLFEEATDF